MPKEQQQAYGANKRDVWVVSAGNGFAGAHFATFPPKLIEPCILAGCPSGGLVLDPFGGAGTVGVVARRHSRHYVLIELNPQYIEMAEARIAEERQPVLWTA
jgi:DNA modification methylase